MVEALGGGPTSILFPGQGAQVVGMTGDWVEAEPAAAELFARAEGLLGYDLLAVCRSGPAERLNTTAVSQPAILVTSLAALEVLRRRDPKPLETATLTAGLSLGEYTALVFAGALGFDDAVRLVHERGRGNFYAKRWHRELRQPRHSRHERRSRRRSRKHDWHDKQRGRQWLVFQFVVEH